MGVGEIIKEVYLDRLDDTSWYDDDPYYRFGMAALPYFIDAFHDVRRKDRGRIVRIIWNSRDPSVLPILAAALRDDSESVWKEALDGIVTLGGEASLKALIDARTNIVNNNLDPERLTWVDEAISQVEKEI